MAYCNVSGKGTALKKKKYGQFFILGKATIYVNHGAN